MNEKISVPIWVVKTLTDDAELDKHIDYYYRKGYKAEEAFEKVIDEIQEYCPKYNKFSSYLSYISTKRVRMHKRNRVQIPQKVLNAVCDEHEFDTLFEHNMSNSQDNKVAFHATMCQIREHVPRFERYSSPESYLRARTFRINGR